MKAKKKILSLLLAIAMILGMLPMTAMPVYAANSPASSVILTTSEGDQRLDSQYPYLVNNKKETTGTLNGSTCTAYFDSTTGTLTLHNYNGGEIDSGTLGGAQDLTVKLMGTNNIDGRLQNESGGDILITADSAATLSITKSGDTSQMLAGIATQISGLHTGPGSITIGGKADITISVTNTNTGVFAKTYGIYTKQGILIEDNAALNITCVAHSQIESAAKGIFTERQNITFNTMGTITVDCSDSTNLKSQPLRSYGNILTKVGTMTLKYTEGGGVTEMGGSGVTFNTGAFVKSKPNATTEIYTPGPLPVTLTPGDGKVTLVAPESSETAHLFAYTTSTISVAAPESGSYKPTGAEYISAGTSKDITATNGEKIFVQVYKFDGSTNKVYGFGEASAIPTAGALAFADSAEYDVPAGMGGTAISPIDVSGGVSGGTPPYAFEKFSGPSWLNVSSTGVISGTRPATAAAATMAQIQVQDSASATKQITIDVGAITAPTYAVTVLNDGHGTASASPASAEAGTEITLSASPNGGYVFKEWQVFSGGVTISGNKFTMPAGDVTVKAVFKEITAPTYSVTVQNDGNGTGSASPASAEAGTEITLSASPASGYVFKEWQVVSGGVTVSANKFTMPAGDVTVKAIFEEITAPTYSVTVQNDGNGTGSASPTSAEAGTEITLSASPASGYVFKEWQVVSGSVTVSANKFTMPAGDVTVKAIFEEITAPTYSVTVQNDGNGTGSASPTSAEAGTEITLSASPASGYVFKEWQVVSGGVTVSANKFTMPAGDVTVKAIFEEITAPTYSVTVQNDGNGTGSASPTSAEAGTEITLSASPASGYVFKEWQVVSGGVTVSANKFTMPAGDVTVKAVFEAATAPTYAVTVQNDGNGTGSASPASAEAGTEITLSASPASGYVFKEWQVVSGSVTVSANKFTMPAGDVTVKAIFEEITAPTYSVTVQNDGNGTGSASPASAEAGTEITLSASPASGYVFKEWQVVSGGVTVSANKFTMPAGDVTVKAVFEAATAPTYAVTVNSGTGSGNYAEGSTVNITAGAPETGKVFDKWTTTDGVTFANSSSANTTFTMPAKAVTVTATYKDAPVTTYAVTVNSGTGGGNFAAGATVSITAGTPATGKVFDKWTTSDGVTFGDANSANTTFVMPAKAVTVTATYKDISSETPDYKIIAGENGIWKKGNTKGIVIISNGDYGDFTGVNVDGIFIDSSNYTSAAGSTVVTLKPAYLETLALGTHIVTLQFGNYSVQTNLTILAADERPDESKPDESKPDESKPDESKPNEEIPKTGESNHTLPLIGLLLLSGSALIGVTRNKKKKKSYNK